MFEEFHQGETWNSSESSIGLPKEAGPIRAGTHALAARAHDGAYTRRARTLPTRSLHDNARPLPYRWGMLHGCVLIVYMYGLNLPCCGHMAQQAEFNFLSLQMDSDPRNALRHHTDATRRRRHGTRPSHVSAIGSAGAAPRRRSR